MVSYSSITRLLEEALSPAAVTELNGSIQELVTQGLTTLDLDRRDAVLITTGDGAILAFDSSEQAHLFAEVFHFAARERNLTRTEPSAIRAFRVGAATGEIDLRPKENGGYDFAGTTIADAVRLEAKAGPGELLIDAQTFSELPDHYQHRYQAAEEVQGKRYEVYTAHRYAIDADSHTLLTDDETLSPAPQAAARLIEHLRADAPEIDFSESLAIVDFLYKMKRLCEFPGAVFDLMLSLQIPGAQRPAEALPCEERCSRVYDWSRARSQIRRLEVIVDRLLVRLLG